jgi:nitroimidazol reductase NimA-like FMN-containing flavoprotein (pyridoxamine 5'-phosphate oxidase superfamily)
VTDESFEPTPRTRVKRLPDRGSFDRALVHAILDEGIICHVGIAVEGQPFVLPMAYARRGDTLLLHGASASRLLKSLSGGVPACVTVTHLDALVIARSTFHHSMNYRSVMVLGTATPILDRERKLQALADLVERLVPGRGPDARPPNEQELKATTILELPLIEVSAKVRSGPPGDEPEDLALPHWAGIIPMTIAYGEPVPSPDLAAGSAVPRYLTGYNRAAPSGERGDAPPPRRRAD